MNKYKLILAYDGTNYGGWQAQSNAVAIQNLVQKALHTILRTPVHVTGSGRTDAGVHALGQVAHFSFEGDIDIFKLKASLNGLLPSDIRILEIESVQNDFHARYSASGKTYHYHLHLDKVQNPFKKLYSMHVMHKFDLALAKQAAQLFVGTHDFTSFAHQAKEGSASKNPVRTIRRLELVEEPGGVRLEFEGDGFLYKMVRNIVGTLLEAGSEKISLDGIRDIFSAKDRRKAFKTAPPQGLFLVKVDYS